MTKTLLAICFILSTISYSDHQSDLLENFELNGTAQIKNFSAQLKQQLSSAMQAGGAIAAVELCKLKAPEIADNINKGSLLKIKRTSLELRNLNNAPEDWEQKILVLFTQQYANGKPAGELVYSEQIDDQNITTLRMMRAIPIQTVCLTCHGDPQTLAPELTKALQENYPNDNATGYSIDELRGAFSLTQTITY